MRECDKSREARRCRQSRLDVQWAPTTPPMAGHILRAPAKRRLRPSPHRSSQDGRGLIGRRAGRGPFSSWAALDASHALPRPLGLGTPTSKRAGDTKTEVVVPVVAWVPVAVRRAGVLWVVVPRAATHHGWRPTRLSVCAHCVSVRKPRRPVKGRIRFGKRKR